MGEEYLQTEMKLTAMSLSKEEAEKLVVARMKVTRDRSRITSP